MATSKYLLHGFNDAYFIDYDYLKAVMPLVTFDAGVERKIQDVYC